MKLELTNKENEVIESKMQIEPETEKVLVDSIIPYQNHKLFEFHAIEGGFRVIQTEWKTKKELVFKWINNKWVEEKPKPIFIDIFNPDFKAERTSHNFIKQQGVNYVTALNRKNAIDRFFKINSHLNKNNICIL